MRVKRQIMSIKIKMFFWSPDPERHIICEPHFGYVGAQVKYGILLRKGKPLKEIKVMTHEKTKTKRYIYSFKSNPRVHHTHQFLSSV